MKQANILVVDEKEFCEETLKKTGNRVISSYQNKQETQLNKENKKKFSKKSQSNKDLVEELEQKNIELEERLIKSEERFRMLIERMSDGFVELDKNFCYTYVNNKICEIARCDAQSLLGKYIWDEFPEAVGSSTYEAFNKAMIEQKYVRNTDYYAPLDLWQENHIYPSPDGLFVFIRDITAQKKTERKLIENEQRFRALIENMNDAIVLNDEHSNILYQSPSVTKILGYTLEERCGKQVLEYVHPDNHEEFIQLYEELNANPGHPNPFQFRFKHKKGHYIWLEGVVTNLLHDPSVKAYVANYRDISERKEVEENRDLILDRFKQAQQIAHLGHWEVDFRTQKSAWSDEAFRIYGMEPGSAEPSEELFLKHIHPDDLERVKSLMKQSMKTLTSQSFYHRIIQGNGNVRNLYSVSRFEFDKSHNPIGLYGVCLDVTELTEKEKKLEQANKELEIFIYKTSHDLQRPISTVLGLVNVAKSEVRDSQALKFITTIGDVTKQQHRMLLNLVKVMSIRDRKLALETFELGKLLHEILESLESVDGFDDVRFNIDNRYNELIFSDRNLLFDVLSQLIKNSICYRNLNQSVSTVTIAVRRERKEKLVIEVEDNGLGIPEEVKVNVFDMFFRGTNLSKGSGLGLYFVKNAVEKLDGTIELNSIVNHGSTFSIKIPLQSSISGDWKCP